MEGGTKDPIHEQIETHKMLYRDMVEVNPASIPLRNCTHSLYASMTSFHMTVCAVGPNKDTKIFDMSLEQVFGECLVRVAEMRNDIINLRIK